MSAYFLKHHQIFSYFSWMLRNQVRTVTTKKEESLELFIDFNFRKYCITGQVHEPIKSIYKYIIT